MSASRTPARTPWAARAMARLTAVVDLPTPPLPEATATTLRIRGCGLRPGCTLRLLIGERLIAYRCQGEPGAAPGHSARPGLLATTAGSPAGNIPQEPRTAIRQDRPRTRIAYPPATSSARGVRLANLAVLRPTRLDERVRTRA